MSLENYFKRLNDKKITEPGSKIVPFENDLEICPNFFIERNLYEKMYEHQKEGVKWLYDHFEKKEGCILADDMGLGKTIQTIALLGSLFRYNRIKHVLIVAPTTLLINWKNEFKKWVNYEVSLTTIDGSISLNRRNQLLHDVKRTEGILLITYNLARNLKEDLTKHRGKDFFWDYIVLDEAHKIKNQSKTTREIQELSSHCRLAITGTPVQNNLSELWSIFNFAMQGTLLGSYATFKRVYEKPIMASRDKDCSKTQRILGNKIAKSLRNIYEPFILRRTKEQIFGVKKATDICKNNNLPNKYDWVIWIKLNEKQLQLYQEFLNSDEVKQILYDRSLIKSPLMQLLVLKKICDHPRLLSTNTFEKIIYNSNEIALNNLNSLDVPVEVLLNESSKLHFLKNLLLILVEQKHKILLFSTSTKMLDIIEKVLNENKLKFCRLDGRIISNDKREVIVKNFKTNPDIQIMILTIQVGGVGLTLTEASRVIIYDPNWNPGSDQQAVDRAYRIGQKNENVIVYRLITCSSVEEKIYSRQVFKDSLNKQTIGKENDPTRYFSSNDLYELFKLGDFKKSKVCDQFNEMHGTLEEQLLMQKQDLENIEFTEEQVKVLKHKEEVKKLINVYDLSEHSLLFTKMNETLNSSNIEFDYINTEVEAAKELLFKENKSQNMPKKINAYLDNDNLSAKHQYLNKKFGVEFLPLGNLNYQNRNNKPLFKKPEQPIIIVSEEDEVVKISSPLNENRQNSSKIIENVEDINNLCSSFETSIILNDSNIRNSETSIVLNDSNTSSTERSISLNSTIELKTVNDSSIIFLD